MTITVNQLITDAFRDAQILRPTQAPPAEYSDEAKRKLDQMLALWEADGVETGYYSSVVLSDDMPVDDEYIEPIQYNLAVRLCSLYGRSAPPELVVLAMASRAVLDKRTAEVVELDMTHLPQGSIGHYNINTDDFS
jgi:hypothetical protein